MQGRHLCHQPSRPREQGGREIPRAVTLHRPHHRWPRRRCRCPSPQQPSPPGQGPPASQPSFQGRQQQRQQTRWAAKRSATDAPVARDGGFSRGSVGVPQGPTTAHAPCHLLMQTPGTCAPGPPSNQCREGERTRGGPSPHALTATPRARLPHFQEGRGAYRRTSRRPADRTGAPGNPLLPQR